jgi:hypothetical protein
MGNPGWRPKNSGGVTPTIINGTPAMVIFLFTTDRSPPNLRRQKPSPITHTGAASGRLSASTNNRPTEAWIPSVEK